MEAFPTVMEERRRTKGKKGAPTKVTLCCFVHPVDLY